MPKRSAGLILYRRLNSELNVFLVHPGGPFWSKKDLGAWSIPKGEYLEGEEPLEVAKREFEEETGLAPAGSFLALGDLKQPGGKIITAWALVTSQSSPRGTRAMTPSFPRAPERSATFLSTMVTTRRGLANII